MSHTPTIIFLDQSGQLGGAELCLADLIPHLEAESRVILFDEGPFVEELKRRGIAVEVIPLSKRAAQVGKGAKLGSLFRLLPDLWSHHRRLRRAIREADLVYLNTPKAAVLGGFAARCEKKPTLYHLHDLLSAEHFSAMNRRMLVRAGNRAAAVLANSTATLQAYREAGGTNPIAYVIPNGFDPRATETLPDKSSCRNLLCEELELPTAPPLVAIFGRISPWKGQAVVLEALRKLPEARLLIVGEALFTEEDRHYKEELIRQAGTDDLAGRIHFMGFRRDVLHLMRAVDVVVHASTAAEPFGRVIVEAMLVETPVVATDAGGAKEILEPSCPQWLVPPGESQALAEILQGILDRPDPTAALVRGNRTSAIQRFDQELIAAQFGEVIQSVLSKA